MAIFSRKKSKAKKEEEEAKIAAAKTASAAKKPQRGRNGKIIAPVETPSSDLVHDIPAPSQLPRDFHSPQVRQRASNRDRGHSFDEENPNDNGKHDYFDPHSSGDSGYATPGPDYQGNPRPLSPTGHLPVPAKSTSRLTLGEELAQEAAIVDHSNEAADQQQKNGHKTLKTSRSLQVLRQHTETTHHSPLVNPLTHHYQYQDGRQQRLIQQSMPMRPSSVPAQALQTKFERMQSMPVQRGRSFRIAENAEPIPTQDGFAPPLNILNGLKVNKRGLILNEEGDAIGELSEGDILDCVREKANECGDVMDEYGRVVGKVRTLPMRLAGSNLRRSMTSASTWEHRRDVSSLPPLPALRPADVSPQFDEDSRDDYNKQYEPVSTMPHDAGEVDMHQAHSNEHAAQQDASIINSSLLGSSIHRSESLPSVPETHSTAEIALSEDGSSTSARAHQVALEVEPESKLVSAQQTNADKAEQSRAVMETDKVLNSPAAGLSKSVAFVNPAEENFGMPTTMPAFARSVSEQVMWNGIAPPVPQVPRNFLNGQPAGLFTPSNRAKAAPLPAFPGRGLTVGLAGGGFNGPMPGVQNRRLTMPAYTSQGISSLNGQKPRTSAPLVRSPLSSHETTPPGSAPASPKGYFKPTYAQPQGHSRSQSLKTVNTTASAPGGAKPRKVFGHAGQAAADKNAEIVVKEVADDKKADKKKKGMKGLFGKKK